MPYVLPESGLPLIHTPERWSDSFDVKLHSGTNKIAYIDYEAETGKEYYGWEKRVWVWEERIKVSDH